MLATTGKTARIWDLKTGKLAHEFECHDANTWGCAFLPTKHLILTGSHDATLRIWNYKNEKLVRKILLPAKVRALAVSPKKNHAAVSLFDKIVEPTGAVEIIDLDSGDAIAQFKSFKGSVSSVAFSSDGKRLLTASFDRSARLWDIETGKVIKEFKTHERQVEAAAFIRDNSLIITASGRRIDRDYRDLGCCDRRTALAK